MAQGFGRRDYYRILQVDPSAHPEIVHAAYRTLLRALRKHPDLGGADGEARAIIEAYETLGRPERRQAYDLWLSAHSAAPIPAPRHAAAPPPPPVLLPEVKDWIRSALAEYHDAPWAPFASRFDLVLEAPGPSTDRLYVKAFPLLARARWPTAFTLCRAVAVGRSGLLPSADVVLLVGNQVDELQDLLDESMHHSTQWSWNRCLIAVCMPSPIRVRAGRIVLMPSTLKRLMAAA
jgi:DnaJ-like protein